MVEHYQKYLLIGSGGREYSIAQALAKTADLKIYVVSSQVNPGLTKLATKYIKLNPSDQSCYHDLINYAKLFHIEVAVIGPEKPLELGLADLLRGQLGIKVIGPNAVLAQIETSKIFARDLLQEDQYLSQFNPQYEVHESQGNLRNSQLIPGDDFVVKADGLNGGKGVMVSNSADHHSVLDGIEYTFLLSQQNKRFLVEERLEGEEFSLISFFDQNQNRFDFPPVQDYKRLANGDRGSNTGGMGAVTCGDHLLPFLTQADLELARKINQLVVEKLNSKTGEQYLGFLYGSFIKNLETGQIKVIEFNCRLGDPEAINLLHLLTTPLSLVFDLAIVGKLNLLSGQQTKDHFRPDNSMTIYCVPIAYPGKSKELLPEEVDLSACPLTDQLSLSKKIRWIPASLVGVPNREHRYHLLGSRAFAYYLSSSNLSLREIKERLLEVIDLNQLEEKVKYRTDIGDRLTKYLTEGNLGKINYTQSGVNIDEGNLAVSAIKELVRATYPPAQLSVQQSYGGFGGVFQVNSETTLVASTDGIGTKVQTLLNLLSNRSEAFRILGQDIFHNNLNDLLCVGSEVTPLFFLDYFGTAKLDHRDLYWMVESLGQECQQTNCVLLGGETAELRDFSQEWQNYYQGRPLTDQTKSVTRPNNAEIVGTIVGQLKGIGFPTREIQEGDLLLGLASNGLHTNGYSLINQLITSGRLKLTWELTQWLCQPHRGYYQSFRSLTPEQRKRIKGLVHVTGGGLIDNPERVIPGHLECQFELEIPENFRLIQKSAGLSEKELMRTFNCGVGMILVIPNDQELKQQMIEDLGADLVGEIKKRG